MFVMPIWSFRPLEFELYVIAHECVATLECDATRECDAAHACDTTLKYDATHACDVVAAVACGNSYGCKVDTAFECNDSQFAYGHVEITTLVYTSYPYRVSQMTDQDGVVLSSGQIIVEVG